MGGVVDITNGYGDLGKQQMGDFNKIIDLSLNSINPLK